MAKRKIVIALGGNAIISKDASARAQQAALAQTAKYLIEFIKNGDELIITHGNGPQVGNLLLQQTAADSYENPALPLDTLVAMTEGSISYWLQTALLNELRKNAIDKEVVSVVTEVLVSADDPAFKKPSKPIGPFLSEEEAYLQEKMTGAVYREDAGRGWRKVVASPRPIAIQEVATIKALINSGTVVITAGGGGIPVIEDPKTKDLKGVEAVVDKDLASQLLAEKVEADLFIILTGVEYVYINYGQPSQEKLEEIRVSQLRNLIKQGQFAAGSMLPKVEAAASFVESHPKGKAIITSLENVASLISENAGTRVIAD
ncbi:carbamate kinase [Streptococcus orisasini]|uniref:carbamate kinase n=1 Tax=Streptococcus orisasini TaxID=1080071 RepID=UPI00070A9AB5|nr:carbamate kinase [Streptococcus orisasini]